MAGNTGGAVNGLAYSIGINRTTGSTQVNYAYTPRSSCTSQPCILTPQDGISPVSHFVALSGTGVPGDSLAVLLNNAPVGFVVVGPDGTWEALPDLSFEGSSVQIQVLDQTSLDRSNTITVFPQTAGLAWGPVTPPRFRLLPLRHADIFVAAGRSLKQAVIYGPKWTHTALYLGGDNNGTPMVAEAVTPDETDASGQQVRSVSLENSLGVDGKSNSWIGTEKWFAQLKAEMQLSVGRRRLPTAVCLIGVPLNLPNRLKVLLIGMSLAWQVPVSRSIFPTRTT
jgi:hypothetical protein